MAKLFPRFRVIARSRPSTKARRRSRRRMLLESLEDRRLLATIQVTTPKDIVDADDGVVSLREAITIANETAGADTIDVTGVSGRITLALGQLEITDDVTINGPGQDNLTIDASRRSRVLNIEGPATNVVLSGLTLTGGQTEGDNQLDGSPPPQDEAAYRYSGGGIRFLSLGELTLDGVTVIRNSTVGLAADGGGIFSVAGSIFLIGSTMSMNNTQGDAANGGGISTFSGAVTARETIFSDNVTSGEGASGGGIYTYSGDVHFSQSTFTRNRTFGSRASGGAIMTDLGNVTLQASILSGNRTTGDFARGGGIGSDSGAVTLDRSSVAGNYTMGESSGGGGIYIGSGSVTLTRSGIEDNYTSGAASGGGGIFSLGGDVSLISSTIARNSAYRSDANGGGVYLIFGSLALTSSTVSENESRANGGGISVSSGGEVMITNSTIARNTASGTGSTGGGLHADAASVVIVNSTVVDNEATESSGGIWLSRSIRPEDDSKLVVRNSIIAGNSDSGTNPDLNVPLDTDNHLDIQFSLIGDATGTDETLVDGVNNNIVGVDWMTVLENDGTNATLKDNGGPTQTIALIVNSDNPDRDAVDAGSNALAKDPSGMDLAEDQRGIVGRRFNGTVDMGAFEFDTFDFDADDFVVNSVADRLFLSDTEVTLRDAIFAANVTAGEQAIDASAVTGTITLTAGQLEITDSVTINGPGRNNLTVDADRKSRVLNVEGDAIDVTLSGLTLSGGRTRGDNQFDPLLETDDATKYSGGGIRFLSAGQLTILSSTVSGNSTSGNYSQGGGVFSRTGSVTLYGSAVTNNTTEGKYAEGAGIFAHSGSITLSESTVSENETRGYRASGGGLASVNDDVTVINSTISGNITSGQYAYGGGISKTGGTLTLTNSTVALNVANDRGGGMWLDGSGLNLFGSTVAGNRTEQVGGGIALADSFLGGRGAWTIYNSIIVGNTGFGTYPEFDDLFALPAADDLDVQFSLMGDLSGSRPPIVDGIDGNIVGADWRRVLENDGTTPTLKNNGGPTETIALIVNWEYPERDAIDAGSNELAIGADGNPLLFDQRGNFDRRFGDSVDIGAVEQNEFIRPSFGQEDFVVTSLADTFLLSDSEVTLREAIYAANITDGDQTIDATGVSGTITLQFGELNVLDDVMINGPKNDELTIDANQQSRVLSVQGDAVDVTLANLTLTGGLTTGDNQGIFGKEFAGGGIRFLSDGQLTLVGTTIWGNRTTGRRALGGGIFASSGNVVIQSSTVAANRTADERAGGGGIAVITADLTLINSTITGNTAAGAAGGGVYSAFNAVEVVNSTITNNRAGSYGGGISWFRDDPDDSLTIQNSIVAGNRDNGTAPDINPPTFNLDVRFSLIGDPTGIVGRVFNGTPTDGTDGNIFGVNWKTVLENDGTTPTLKNNGGPTATIAIIVNSNNPDRDAVDGGNNSLAVDRSGNPLQYDQRGNGFDRLLKGADSFAPTVDIGAFELPVEGIVEFDEDDLVVNSTADTLLLGDDEVTLRDAIAAANIVPGHQTIDATGISGTITLIEGQLAITDDVTIIGPGQETLTIDADQKSRVMRISRNALDVTIIGLTLTGGLTTGDNQVVNSNVETASFSGGGIRFDSAGDLTLTRSAVTGNRTTGEGAAGGGIFSQAGSIILDDSTVADNGTDNFFAKGGGIYSGAGGIAVRQSTIADNRASGRSSSGGGIYSRSGTVTLLDATISGNVSGYDSSGTAGENNSGIAAFSIAPIGAASIILTSPILVPWVPTRNANADGGGLAVYSGDVVITNSTVVGNRADGSESNGGGLWVQDAGLSVVNSTIAGNTAGNIGGGIRKINRRAKLIIHNSIVAGNSAAGYAPDIRTYIEQESASDVQYSLIGDAKGITGDLGLADGDSGNIIGVDWKTVLENDGTIPLLKDNGGPTKTIALIVNPDDEDRDAINAGSNALAKDPEGKTLLSDQRGFPVRWYGGTVDLGAFEQFKLNADDFIVNSTADTLQLGTNDVTLRDAIYAANLTPGHQTIDVTSVSGTIEIDLEQLEIADGFGFELTDNANWRIAGQVTQDGRFALRADNSIGGGETVLEVTLPSPWYNFLRPGDVNNDGTVQASDALRIINELARREYSDGDTGQTDDPGSFAAWPDLYFDQNGDGKTTAVDALRIVNELGRQQSDETVDGEAIAIVTGLQRTSVATLLPEASADGSIEVSPVLMADTIGARYQQPGVRKEELRKVDRSTADDQEENELAADQLFADVKLLDDLITSWGE